MNINFNLQGDLYTAILQLSGPAAIHLEREKPGALHFGQRSCDEGRFAKIKDNPFSSQDLVVDTVITSEVYPFYVKIESSEQITLAVVTSYSDVEVL